MATRACSGPGGAPGRAVWACFGVARALKMVAPSRQCARKGQGSQPVLPARPPSRAPGPPACCQRGLPAWPRACQPCQESLSACHLGLPARPTSLSAPLARLSFLPAPGLPSGPTSLPHGPASLPLGCQPSSLPPASVTWAPGPPTWTFSPDEPVTRRRKYMGVGRLMVGRGSQT